MVRSVHKIHVMPYEDRRPSVVLDLSDRPAAGYCPSPLQSPSAQDLLQLQLISCEPFTLSQGRFLRSF